MSSWLEKITTEAATRGTKTVISGGEGVGKTSTAAYFPDPVFLVAAGEDSLGTLQEAGEIPASGDGRKRPKPDLQADVLVKFIPGIRLTARLHQLAAQMSSRHPIGVPGPTPHRTAESRIRGR